MARLIGSDINFNPSPYRGGGSSAPPRPPTTPVAPEAGIFPSPHPAAEPANPASFPPQSASERLLSQAIAAEYHHGKLGLILGLSVILVGLILCLNGAAGSTSWTAKALGLESSINDAAPGVVLFVVGLFCIWRTSPVVDLKKLRG